MWRHKTEVHSQNFEQLRLQCLRDGKLFEDPEFPAQPSSLVHGMPFTPEWKRPSEIVRDPKMFVDGASRFDVEQGNLDNSWLIAAMALLPQYKAILDKVVPENQSFTRRYAGIFKFQFWHFGDWVDIVVDDRLPTYNGKLVFAHSSDENEFWSALLEKAYAKLYGGYDNLKDGSPLEALVDFTGNIVEHIELRKAPKNLHKTLSRLERSSLMCCYIKNDPLWRKEVTKTGLVKGQYYSITKVRSVVARSGRRSEKVELICLRNPTGNTEWKGDWSDNSNQWKKIDDNQKQQIDLVWDKDGEFWMSYEDFKKNFTDIQTCIYSGLSLYANEDLAWESTTIHGSWDCSEDTAGGCRNFIKSFSKNKQYIIDLEEDSNKDQKCSVIIGLMQKHRRRIGLQNLTIGFSIYKAPDRKTSSLDLQYFQKNKSIARSDSFTKAREITEHFDLDPSTRYIIIPTTFEPDQEGEFLLRIFVEKATNSENGQSQVSPQLRAMFDRISGADNRIDAYDVQDLVSAKFRTIDSSVELHLNTCRSLIVMLDDKKSGTLDFDGFCSLVVLTTQWMRAFSTFDRDRSKKLNKFEAMNAISRLGYERLAYFDSIFNRFAPNGYMRIEDFVGCVCRIKIMTDAFEKNSAQTGQLQLSKEEFFSIVLDL